MTRFGSGSITNVFAHPRLPAGYRGGRSRPSQGGNVGARNRTSQTHYVCQDPRQFRLSRFATFTHLLAAWEKLRLEGGQGSGVDGLTFRDFSKGERNEALRAAAYSINRRTYRPQPLRVARVPKGNGSFRELLLQTVIDRVVAKALLMTLNQWVKQIFPNYGRDVWRTYAQMENHVRRHQTYWLAIDDIRNCYPSVPTTPAIEAFCRDFYRADDLVWLVIQIIRGHDGCGKQDGVDQGSPLAPSVVEAFLYRNLDVVLGAQYLGDPLRFRYYDNLPILANSESEGSRLLHATGEILERHGMSLKGEDISGDLTDPQYSGVLLGFTPHWRDGQMRFTIPETAFEDLNAGFQRANEMCNSRLTAEYIAHGWLQAHGPALTKTVLPSIVDRVISSASQYGFRLPLAQQLAETGKLARQRWLGLASSERSRA